MEYLPAEIKLKIFKNLKFDELIKIKHTNKYFYNFINKYEDDLARKKFYKLSFTFRDYKKIKLETIYFPLNNNIQEKWQSVVDKEIQIPIYLDIERINQISKYSLNENPTLHFYPKVSSKEDDVFTLKLPLYPKNIDELKIVRYWLNQIVRCDFGYLEFDKIIFNPEMIKLLFDDDEITKFKFNCKIASLYFLYQNTFAWKFTLENLVISEYIRIVFIYRYRLNTTEEDNNFLLLLNTGDKIPVIEFVAINSLNILYNLLINHIETATDLSKMVAKINVDCFDDPWPHSKLTVRGVEIDESNNKKKYYKIKNIHNPKIMFLVKVILDTDTLRDTIEYIEISQIKC